MDSIIKPNDNIPIGYPVLLRTARKTYAWAIHIALQDAGFTDIPRNGVYILVGLARKQAAAIQLVKELGISKQAASKLVEALVDSEYIVREQHEEDRRKQVLRLTDRGKAAAIV